MIHPLKKQCSTCHKLISLSDFHRDPRTMDRHTNKCRFCSRVGRSPVELSERFSNLYRIDDSECWIWTGKAKIYGYVRTGTVKNGNRKTSLAHRVSYELNIGPIPFGSCVLHRCDVPLCVNPDHLFLGTNEDNLNDMLSKGRSCKGERNCKAKLCEEDVLYIREASESTKTLSAKYGVTTGTINRARSGETWRHL